MWNLHPRHDPRNSLPSGTISFSIIGRDQGRFSGEPLPVHGICRHYKSGAGRSDIIKLMRGNVQHYDVVAPRSFAAALDLLADTQVGYIPMAGGTELMVAFAAGRLPPCRLISINHLAELRFIRESECGIVVGANTTFTDIRKSELLRHRFNLLAQAASWTGSVANQNRGTLGGNIVNASPAADSPPVLLAYEASVHLISTRGVRAVKYSNFHLGYKLTALAKDELLHSISLPLPSSGWRGYVRKVGTRNAQAISKVALAGRARVEQGVIREIRLGAASLSEVPMRCYSTEELLTGRSLSRETTLMARQALAGEIHPIDDIRSTAAYRAAVAGNLLEEFLGSL